ncbi:MAG: class I SAM-dependent methyltransferase [Firmicutes bacterium]|nr:class I SAM-dependent methyltransferase [Bacillota bacterium]
MGNTEKFQMMAHQYDTADRIVNAKLSADMIREAFDAKESKGKNAMDFGCGTGLVGLSLLDVFDSMTFLDTSSNMLEIVAKKVEANMDGASSDHNRIKLLCVDLEADNAIEGSWDVIFMVQVLLHVSDPMALLAKLYRHISPSGKLIIIDFDENEAVKSDLVHAGFNQTVLAKGLEQLGFKGITSKTFYEADNLFMKQRASQFIMVAEKGD